MISVVDSCVAIKWYADEHDSDLAEALLGRPLIAPDLIRSEVANSLWKKVRQGELKRAPTGRALQHLARSVKFFRAEPLAEAALELALDLGHPVYDCFFLALAQMLDFPLVTADERLWKRTRRTPLSGHVIMLRDWRPTDD